MLKRAVFDTVQLLTKYPLLLNINFLTFTRTTTDLCLHELNGSSQATPVSLRTFKSFSSSLSLGRLSGLFH